jgi:pimeloyl-ACP methyl ester carboxylesterase
MTKRSESLGQEHRIRLPAGEVRYFERGEGAPVVFVHGVLTNAELWRKVVPDVAAAGFRCLAPDLPLGSHDLPMRADADLSPTGNADLIADFLDALDLRAVTLVANDTGGALTQILLANGPTDRIARVVLTPSDAFDNFFPPMFRPLQYLARVPGAVNGLVQSMRAPALRRLPLAYGWLTKHRVPDEVTAGWVKGCQTDKGVRLDTAKLLRGVNKRYTLAAAERLHTFDRPVLLAWAPEDRFFPIETARRLAELFPDARIEEIPDSRTFVPEDQPERLAELVTEFAGAELAAR